MITKSVIPLITFSLLMNQSWGSPLIEFLAAINFQSSISGTNSTFPLVIFISFRLYFSHLECNSIVNFSSHIFSS